MTLPRFNPRLLSIIPAFTDEDEGFFWFANFATTTTLTVGWPSLLGKKQFALSPIGTPYLRTG